MFFILGAALIALFAIKTGYLILLYRWLFRYAMKKHVNLARQLLAGYLSAPYTLHLQRNSAELIRVTTRSVEDFTNIFMVNLLIVLGRVFGSGGADHFVDDRRAVSNAWRPSRPRRSDRAGLSINAAWVRRVGTHR